MFGYLFDFGGNGQRVEERDLGGVHASGARRDENIQRCNSTNLGCGLDFVGFDDWFEFEDWGVSEDEPDFAGQEVSEGVKFLDGWSEF
jgi:hypothetical protein